MTRTINTDDTRAKLRAISHIPNNKEAIVGHFSSHLISIHECLLEIIDELRSIRDRQSKDAACGFKPVSEE